MKGSRQRRKAPPKEAPPSTCPTALRLIAWDVSIDGRPATALCGLLIGGAVVPGVGKERVVIQMLNETAEYAATLLSTSILGKAESTEGLDANRLMTNLSNIKIRR